MNNKHAIGSQNIEFVLTLYPSHIKSPWLNIPASYRDQFSNTNLTPVQLEVDGKIVETTLRLHPSRPHNLLGGGLTEWFKDHPELEVGDKVRITVLVPKKKYQLEIIG